MRGAVVAAALGLTAPCPECGEPLPVTVESARVKNGRASYALTVGGCEAWCSLLTTGVRLYPDPGLPFPQIDPPDTGTGHAS